jgi:TetR/AcrR family transcriptional regulator, transcriptional repressor of bet genes
MATVDAKRPERERAETRRRADLIAATVAEIGATGSLDVTVGRIAGRAGISPALAFHYFGDKDTLFLSAMRHVLAVFGRDVRAALAGAAGPEARVVAIIGASFSPENFRRDSVAAWLNFYVLAQRSARARRLLSVYRRRLVSNLAHALRPRLGQGARPAAERLAGLIDGLYLHAALDAEIRADEAKGHVLAALTHELTGAR